MTSLYIRVELGLGQVTDEVIRGLGTDETIDRKRQAVTLETLKADHRRSAEMRELRTVDRTRQQQLIQTLTVMQSLQREVTPLLDSALTWWNSHVMTVSHDDAYAMTWAYLRKKTTDKYCSRNEMKKLEAELWNLKVKGTDVIGQTNVFRKLVLACVLDFSEESNKIERYVIGLPDMIHGNIVALKPKNPSKRLLKWPRKLMKEMSRYTIAENRLRQYEV
ncbi:reverse transcriptase domain-containing protein [Tanacetum coccineum]|uniref:Reverse transcriptase domain-containing protein n=1 Tax=Tanacetum coccineum TaxID=301880 RepID=A0ABQ4ZH69_9ASTR